jgi:hypothetical protein
MAHQYQIDRGGSCELTLAALISAEHPPVSVCSGKKQGGNSERLSKVNLTSSWVRKHAAAATAKMATRIERIA